jgi:hypothetical protein
MLCKECAAGLVEKKKVAKAEAVTIFIRKSQGILLARADLSD